MSDTPATEPQVHSVPQRYSELCRFVSFLQPSPFVSLPDNFLLEWFHL